MDIYRHICLEIFQNHEFYGEFETFYIVSKNSVRMLCQRIL